MGAPSQAFPCLRIMFFLLSFVLEDAALCELLPSPRRQRAALALVASSYVTWTYQTHTFSNSIETLAVLWALVFVQRVVAARTTPYLYAALLGAVSVFGVFNRITFPAFLVRVARMQAVLGQVRGVCVVQDVVEWGDDGRATVERRVDGDRERGCARRREHERHERQRAPQQMRQQRVRARQHQERRERDAVEDAKDADRAE